VGGKKLKLTIWDTGKVFFPVSDNGSNMFVSCCLVQQGQLFHYSSALSIFFFSLFCSRPGEVQNNYQLLLQGCSWDYSR
jgi:hypothetical protein